MISIEPAVAADLRAITVLLEHAQLPSADLGAQSLAYFLVARADDPGTLIGVVGIESHMPSGLLRSLVVATAQRGLGLGAMLVDAIEARARSLGIEELVLLTTTAEAFFARRGYDRIARSEAPTALHATSEFALLCPASAACMRKRLAA